MSSLFQSDKNGDVNSEEKMEVEKDISQLVHPFLEQEITSFLTPKRSIDVLLDIYEKKLRPYVDHLEREIHEFAMREHETYDGIAFEYTKMLLMDRPVIIGIFSQLLSRRTGYMVIRRSVLPVLWLYIYWYPDFMIRNNTLDLGMNRDYFYYYMNRDGSDFKINNLDDILKISLKGRGANSDDEAEDIQ